MPDLSGGGAPGAALGPPHPPARRTAAPWSVDKDHDFGRCPGRRWQIQRCSGCGSITVAVSASSRSATPVLISLPTHPLLSPNHTPKKASRSVQKCFFWIRYEIFLIYLFIYVVQIKGAEMSNLYIHDLTLSEQIHVTSKLFNELTCAIQTELCLFSSNVPTMHD